MSQGATLIAVDWGSSNCRAYLTNNNADLLARVSSPQGMLQLKPAQFAEALEALVGEWLVQYPHIPILMSGMVGARQGWQEAAYLNCPVNLAELSTQLTEVDFIEGHSAAIVPGLAIQSAQSPDVMRGEETQLLGAITSTDETQQVCCMPGTHSKWVWVKDGAVKQFHTCITGELYALLVKHSILSKVDAPQVEDETAFMHGVNTAKSFKGLLTDLFKVRASTLLGHLSPASTHAYLSGLLIGYEIMEARAYWDAIEEKQIQVIGDAQIAEKYLAAFSAFGCCRGVACDPEEAVVRGLVAIHKRSKK